MHTDLVIDADGHCNEPWEDLTPWMPLEYHHRAPVGFNDRHGTSRMYVEGRLSTRAEGLGPGVSGPFAPHIRGGRPGGRDARQRLTDMDEEGIDVAIIFGTRVALSVNGLRDKGLAGVCVAPSTAGCGGVSAHRPKASKGRWPHPLPGSAGGRQGAGAAHPASPRWHRQRHAPSQRLRHQPRRPPLRSDLRTCRGRRPAARGAPADRPRRPVRRLGRPWAQAPSAWRSIATCT